MAAVALVDADGLRTAWLGCGPESDFEIGSVTKGITGLLYADAVERGEVTPETMLGDLLPLAGTRAAAVTLGALSRHSSGLPRLPTGQPVVRRTLEFWVRGRNPYRQTRDELVEELRTVKPGRPRPRYSNLGYAVLGHALAAAAETTYADLVQARIARPLRLDALYATYSHADLRATSLIGSNRRGRPSEPWGERGHRTRRHHPLLHWRPRPTGSAALADGSAPGSAPWTGGPVRRTRGPDRRRLAGDGAPGSEGHLAQRWHRRLPELGGCRPGCGHRRRRGHGNHAVSRPARFRAAGRAQSLSPRLSPPGGALWKVPGSAKARLSRTSRPRSRAERRKEEPC